VYCQNCGKQIADGSLFCAQRAKAVSVTQPAGRKLNAPEVIWKIFFTIVVIVGVLLMFIYIGVHLRSSSGGSGSTNPTAAIIGHPVTERLFSGAMIVQANQIRFWTFTISPQMTNVQLIGSFHASSRTGNDIETLIADQSDSENWKNGHEARVYYTSGRTTNGRFNVHLSPGRYVLAFSNKFSLVTGKNVTADIELNYLR
jgi:hypothetical protein